MGDLMERLNDLREQIQQPVEEKKEPVKLRLSDGTEVDVAPTYQGMNITKYNGHDTASFAQHLKQLNYIGAYNDLPDTASPGAIAYVIPTKTVYMYKNNYWYEMK